METQEQAARKQSPRRRTLVMAIAVVALVGAGWLAKPWISAPNPVSQSAEAASRNDIYVTSDIKQLKKAAADGDGLLRSQVVVICKNERNCRVRAC